MHIFPLFFSSKQTFHKYAVSLKIFPLIHLTKKIKNSTAEVFFTDCVTNLINFLDFILMNLHDFLKTQSKVVLFQTLQQTTNIIKQIQFTHPVIMTSLCILVICENSELTNNHGTGENKNLLLPYS